MLFALHAHDRLAYCFLCSTASSAPTVAEPTATPGSGVYTSLIKVQLLSTTPNATIIYTLDGSDPTVSVTSAKLFTRPIRLRAGTVSIRAYAVHPGMRPSAVVTIAYTFSGVSACSGGVGVYCADECGEWFYECDAGGVSSDLQHAPEGTVCANRALVSSDSPVCNDAVSKWCVGKRDSSYCSKSCGADLLRCESGRLVSNVTLTPPLVCHTTALDGGNASVVSKADACAPGMYSYCTLIVHFDDMYAVRDPDCSGGDGGYCVSKCGSEVFTCVNGRRGPNIALPSGKLCVDRAIVASTDQRCNTAVASCAPGQTGIKCFPGNCGAQFHHCVAGTATAPTNMAPGTVCFDGFQIHANDARCISQTGTGGALAMERLTVRDSVTLWGVEAGTFDIAQQGEFRTAVAESLGVSPLDVYIDKVSAVTARRRANDLASDDLRRNLQSTGTTVNYNVQLLLSAVEAIVKQSDVALAMQASSTKQQLQSRLVNNGVPVAAVQRTSASAPAVEVESLSNLLAKPVAIASPTATPGGGPAGDSSGDGLSVGVAVGITAGAMLAGTLLVFGAVVLYKRRKQSTDSKQSPSQPPRSLSPVPTPNTTRRTPPRSPLAPTASRMAVVTTPPSKEGGSSEVWHSPTAGGASSPPRREIAAEARSARGARRARPQAPPPPRGSGHVAQASIPGSTVSDGDESSSDDERTTRPPVMV